MLPTLTQHRGLRLATFAALHAAQGLPFSLFIISIPAWMAAQQYEPAQIGWFIGIAALPWSLKLVVAPIMDHFGFPAMGERVRG